LITDGILFVDQNTQTIVGDSPLPRLELDFRDGNPIIRVPLNLNVRRKSYITHIIMVKDGKPWQIHAMEKPLTVRKWLALDTELYFSFPPPNLPENLSTESLTETILDELFGKPLALGSGE